MELPPIVRRFPITLIYLNNVVALGFKPGITRIILTLPTALLLVSQSLYPYGDPYYADHYWMVCGVVASLFVYFDWIILASPDRERWHKVRDIKSNGDDEKGDWVPQSFRERMWWGMRLATTSRHIGWSQQAKNTPVEVPLGYSKWLFIVRKSLRAAWMYFLTDCLSSYMASTPHGSFRGIEDGKALVGWEGYSLSYQWGLTWLHIIKTYTTVELMTTIYNVASVIFGFAPPRDCPSAFGDLGGMYTVRKSWSAVWHQNCRRLISTPGNFLVRDVLRLRKGSFASKYLQLFSGFFVSATIHGVAAMFCHHSLNDDTAFAVFMAQAVAILIEDHVIKFGRCIGLGDSMFWSAVGYTWTVLWFGFSYRTFASAGVQQGLWENQNLGNFLGIGP